MSSCRYRSVTCPNCQHQGQLEVWDTINADADPVLKKKLLDEFLFHWTCPNCKRTYFAPWETIYQDKTNKFVLSFHPFEEKGEPFNPADPSLRRFTCRSVTGFYRLKEKIYLFESGLSDVAIELMKYYILNGHIKIEGIDTSGRELYFSDQGKDESLGFYVVGQHRDVSTFRLPPSLYHQFLEMADSDGRFTIKEGFVSIDYHWVNALMRR
ncbi:MAG: CpXC domain-containing protein [Bacteroidota bacterium]|nr:CpXC domain-containing protein [Bacteroidota bacterium]